MTKFFLNIKISIDVTSLSTDYKLYTLSTRGNHLKLQITWIPSFVSEIVWTEINWTAVMLYYMTADNGFCALVNDWKKLTHFQSLNVRKNFFIEIKY